MKHLKKFNEEVQHIKLETFAKVEQPSDNESISDLLDIVGSIGHDDIIFYIDWEDDRFESFKKYLIDTYGDEITKYEQFILACY